MTAKDILLLSEVFDSMVTSIMLIAELQGKSTAELIGKLQTQIERRKAQKENRG